MAAAVGLAVVAIASCSPSPSQSSAGSVTISALSLSSGVTVNQVTYAITGNGITPITGSIDVTNAEHATALVSGIPATPSPYLVTMDAAATDHQTTCHGAGTFVVIANQTALASVVLQCRGGFIDRGGTIAINGRLDNCPFIESFTATSLDAPVGGAINVSVTATDFDATDTVSVQWSASPLGVVTIGNSASAQTTVTCTAVGMTAISVAVTDGFCGDSRMAAIPITCHSGSVSGAGGAGAGGSGAGGSGAGGAGTGGSGAGGSGAGGTGAGGSGAGGAGTGGTGAGGTGMGGSGAGGSGAGGSGAGGSGAGGSGVGGAAGAGGAPQVCEAVPTTGATAVACSSCTSISCSLAQSPQGNAGCCGLPSTADVAICVAAAKCFNTNAAQCVVNGDPTSCYCGTSGTACFTSGGNGPCVTQVRAAAKSTSPAVIQTQFTSGSSPLGRAANLLICRGEFCKSECGL